MIEIAKLTDDEIDHLLLLLFDQKVPNIKPPYSLTELSDDQLKRIRANNHPDKQPEVDLAIYQKVVEELHRRRKHQ